MRIEPWLQLGGIACFIVAAGAFPASAAEQAKSIVNSIDPKSMNELIEVAKHQPDAALTNVVPAGVNKFRFLFVWPASNTAMTYERIGRSFAERFLVFADQQKYLTKGYCLKSQSLFFGSTKYGGEEVNVAYRDIEVHFKAGWSPPCAGRFVAASDLDEPEKPAQRQGFGSGYQFRPAPPSGERRDPASEIKPFLPPVRERE